MSDQQLLQEIAEKLNSMELRLVLGSKKYLSVDELAAYLNVEVTTVYNYNKQRIFTRYYPAGKQPYYSREEVDAWIELSGTTHGRKMLRMEDINAIAKQKLRRA